MTKALVPTPPAGSIKQSSTFQEDLPITSITADVLGRGKFAKELAERVRAQRPAKTLIIAITGEWGSGKSSFLNLLEHELHEERTWWQKSLRHGKVVRFAPPYFEDTQDLLALLAEEITERWKWIRRPWRGLLFFLRRHAFSLIVITAFLALVSFGLETCHKDAITASCPTIATLLFPFNTTLFFSFLAFFATTRLIKRSPHEEIKRLSVKRWRLLKDCFQPPPQIIFIDELDRWDGTSVKELINFIKINTTFDNKIFVLAFDKDVVSKHLTENDVPGHIYLEKIIQYELKLPTIGGWTLRELLNKKLREVSKAERWQEACQGNRYDYILDEILSVELTTMRDVHRYINAVSFSADFAVRDLDIQDYLIVELLKLKHSDVFNALSNQKTLLTQILSQPNEDSFRKLVYQLQVWAKQDRQTYPNTVYKALWALFGSVEKPPDAIDNEGQVVYHTSFGTRYHSTPQIVQAAYFDRYFTQQIPAGQLSDSSIRSLMTSENPHQAIDSLIIDGANAATHFAFIIRRLTALLDEMPVQNLSLLQAIEETLVSKELQSIHYTIKGEKANLKTNDDRGAIVTSFERLLLKYSSNLLADKDGKGLESWVQLMSNLDSYFIKLSLLQKLEEHVVWRPIITPEVFDAAQDVVLKKANIALDDPRFWRQSNLRYIIYRLWVLKGNEQIKRKIIDHMESDENFLAFLKSISFPQRTIETGYCSNFPEPFIHDIFDGRDVIEQRLKRLTNSKDTKLRKPAKSLLKKLQNSLTEREFKQQGRANDST